MVVESHSLTSSSSSLEPIVFAGNVEEKVDVNKKNPLSRFGLSEREAKTCVGLENAIIQECQDELFMNGTTKKMTLTNARKFWMKLSTWPSRRSKKNPQSAMITLAECDLVRKSWSYVCMPKHENDCFPVLMFSDAFYSSLFKLAPQTKSYFSNMVSQGYKLSAMLHVLITEIKFLVKGGEYKKGVKNHFSEMYEVHKRVGIDRQLFVYGGKALLQALSTRLGSQYRRKCLLCTSPFGLCSCLSESMTSSFISCAPLSTYQSGSIISLPDCPREGLTLEEAVAWLLVYSTIADCLLHNGKYTNSQDQRERIYKMSMDIDPLLMAKQV
eukprot:CFRG4362T1